MSFISYIPRDELKLFIKSIVISKNENAEEYRILPNTSIVMGFQFSGRISYKKGNIKNPLSNAGVTGLLNEYRIFTNVQNTGSVLVMFSETGAAAFFLHPMHELFGKSLSLDDLILSSQMDVVVEKLNEAKNDLKRIEVVEEFLLSRLNIRVNDEMVTLAVNLIKRHKGDVKIAALAKKLNISQSQFEKRFRKIVGSSPKKFASIVRLNELTKASPGRNGLLNVGLNAGYFDQAHFIKDFKSFTGETPEQFFRKK